MRWLALIVVLVATPASAKMMRPRVPPVISACPRAKTVAQLEACLDRFGAFRIEQVAPHARLVRVWQEDAPGEPRTDLGVYLYVEGTDGSWGAQGTYVGSGTYAVLGLAPLTLTRHAGFRFEIGQELRTPMSLDGGPVVQLMIRQRISVFCGSGNYFCTPVTTQCEALVHGKALMTFHGVLTLHDAVATIAGDRRLAGSVCAQVESESLGWIQGP